MSRPPAERPTPPREAPVSDAATRPSPPGAWAAGQLHRDEGLSPALELLKPLATPKAAPRPGDWLDQYPEPGQTIADFVAERPASGWPKGRAFYLVTIGPLTDDERLLLERTRALLSDWFQQPVEWLAPLPESAVGPTFRRNRASGPQWQTTPILDAAQAHRPDDAIAMMAFTAIDLYPDPEWNFVFGEARPEARVGVTSLARLGPPDSSLALARTVATGAHELGHMLGLAHCVAFECVMNGSNSLDEADR
ncbi:MAG: archaemetzincin, partial [Myxococcaceae bacterium]|nr:archaemetzincin [Myxococcaceae bacterium]